jgi:dihydrofolate reductase
MTTFLNITMSLDGFVAGPNQTLEEPLGQGGEQLHDWIVGLESWRQQHGLEGGETNADANLVRETNERTGAFVMGRRMFSGGSGPWEDDPNRDGWWGDDPPFRNPVFVLTHHARDRVEFENGTSFDFVTDGFEAALEQAQAAAGDRDVLIAGGAETIQQYLAAGLIEEFEIHVAPILLGSGTHLFGELGTQAPQVELTRVLSSPAVAHLGYRVVE